MSQPGEERLGDPLLPVEGASDHSLLQRYQHGSQDAAREIYSRYARRLRALIKAQCSAALARRVEVEDIVQSVFGSFFRKASQAYYDVPAGEELWKLFLVIALNKVREKGTFHRAAKRDVRRTRGSDSLEDVADAGLAQGDEAAFLRVVIEDALEPFPPQARQIVLLRIEGYQIGEIAEKTGRAKRTVERTLQTAREQLAALFQGAE
jgi:RNA polymerase sigma-70 factor (ECF subfamily)